MIEENSFGGCYSLHLQFTPRQKPQNQVSFVRNHEYVWRICNKRGFKALLVKARTLCSRLHLPSNDLWIIVLLTQIAGHILHFGNTEPMDNQQGNANQQEATNPSNSGGFRGMIFEQYRKAKDNVEAYPYVWASYLLVYGGFGLWVSYRYNKLSRTENRVRVLQEKLRNLRQEREPRTSTAAIANISSSIDKPTK